MRDGVYLLLKEVLKMRSFTIVVFLSIFLFLSSSCSKQEAFDDYSNDERALNLQDTFEYEYKNKEIFTSNQLEAEVKFSGIDTLWELNSHKDDRLVVTFASKNKAGKFKALLVKPNQVIETIFENTEEGRSEWVIPKGKSYIRIVGSQSETDIEISYEVGKQTKIIMNKAEENRKYGQIQSKSFNN